MRLSTLMCSVGDSIDLLSAIKLGADIIHIDLAKVGRNNSIELMTTARAMETKGLGKPTAVAVELQNKCPTTGLIERNDTFEGTDKRSSLCVHHVTSNHSRSKPKNTYLPTGSMVIVTTDEQFYNKCSCDTVYINHPHLLSIVPGMKIYLDHGNIILQCMNSNNPYVVCKIVQGGNLTSFMEVYIPGLKAAPPPKLDDVSADMKLFSNHPVDILIIQDVRHSQIFATTALAYKVKIPLILAKITSANSIKEFKADLKNVDGCVISPGREIFEPNSLNLDLNLKEIVDVCIQRNKRVIYMIDLCNSSIEAYNADIDYAIRSGVDGLGFTAHNACPFSNYAINFIDEACQSSEQAIVPQNLANTDLKTVTGKLSAVIDSISVLCAVTQAKCIIVATVCETSVLALSQRRLSVPIFAAISSMSGGRILQACWGVVAVCSAGITETKYGRHLIRFASTCGVLQDGDAFLLVTKTEQSDSINQVSIVKFVKVR